MSDVERSMRKHLGWHVRIPMLVGQINIKPVRGTLFSERYNQVPTFVVFGIRFTWRKWRKAA